MPKKEGEETCRFVLRQAVGEAGGLTQFCVRNAIGAADVSKACHDGRISAKVAEKIGWEKVVVFRKKAEHPRGVV